MPGHTIKQLTQLGWFCSVPGDRCNRTRRGCRICGTGTHVFDLEHRGITTQGLAELLYLSVGRVMLTVVEHLCNKIEYERAMRTMSLAVGGSEIIVQVFTG